MELFALIDDLPHIRVGQQWVGLMDLADTLVELSKAAQAPNETALHVLVRVSLEWHRTGKLPEATP